tara:strand:+ start:500 stop:712 length:213 start_codon:yes stop_codon:yes gene_type:complete
MKENGVLAIICYIFISLLLIYWLYNFLIKHIQNNTNLIRKNSIENDQKILPANTYTNPLYDESNIKNQFI